MRWAVLSISLVLLSAPVAAQDSPLRQARAAYQRAEFQEALAALDRIADGALAPADQADALELRATLLFALRQEGWREALRSLARLSPDHAMPRRLPPQLLSEWQLARAEQRTPNEVVLARARAAYVVADFEGTLTTLARLRHDLTAAQQVERLVLEALARFSLRDLHGTGDVLRQLAVIAPQHRFGPELPPAFRNAWERARGAPGEQQRSES